MNKHLVSFLFFTASSWMCGSIVYKLLASLMPEGYVFGFLYRMFLYHYQHPYQYILVVAIAYGLTATIWARFWGQLTGAKRVFSIIAVMLISVFVASFPGGLLWGIHDVQAGFVPPNHILINNLIRAGMDGLKIGWAIVGLSVPYNIIGLITGYFLTDLGQRRLHVYFDKG